MNNFIGVSLMSDLTICDDLIDYFNKSNNKKLGTTLGVGFKSVVDESVKKSTDVTLGGNDLELHPRLNDYFKELQICLEDYMKTYSYSMTHEEFTVIEPINIQHYEPNGAFYSWHCEKNSSAPSTLMRHLTFMTYLNDVDDGGETEFLYQDVKTKAVKGKTVIFPVEWTHTHRGIPSPTQDKYIITGWFSFKG